MKLFPPLRQYNVQGVEVVVVVPMIPQEKHHEEVMLPVVILFSRCS